MLDTGDDDGEDDPVGDYWLSRDCDMDDVGNVAAEVCGNGASPSVAV